MVDVGAGELSTSRERLLKQAQAAESVGDTAVCGLLYFYAAECALKAEVMRRRSLYMSTAQLPADLRSHDLRRLAKELNLRDPVTRPDPLRCRRHKNGGWIESHQLHEAWRYGARLNDDDQKAALEALKQLVRDARRGC
ncbi:hypothetical protein [Streptomyces sp. NPDC047869]|uniref:hypothetical protein n=1 Tax=Streptomyces sp. NPDC047869 TaxID=3154709 RepID=UPI0034517B65